GDDAVAVALERLGAHDHVAPCRCEPVQQDDRRAGARLLPRQQHAVRIDPEIHEDYPRSVPIDTTDATFERDVIQRSYDETVVVAFWAACCVPCRALTPPLDTA